MSLPVSAREYYDPFPSAEHYPGDIWTHLPTFGALPQRLAPGIVVTPACDLTNCKVESLTYLPIIGVSAFQLSRSSLPEIKRVTSGQLQGAAIATDRLGSSDHAWPIAADVTSLLDRVDQALSGKAVSLKDEACLRRARAGLKLIAALCVHQDDTASLREVEILFGAKECGHAQRRIVTNGRSDTHFLPRDTQPVEWAAVSEHSVALLRFPLSIPLEVVELAQRVRPAQWVEARRTHSALLPCLEHMTEYPMKKLRLKPPFTSDLLTRFTGVFGRLGSPDFSDYTVAAFLAEINE